MQRPKQNASTNLFFILIFLNYFIGISFCVPPYKWDLTNTVNNVHTFATFMDDLFISYSEGNDKMDRINAYDVATDPFPENYSDKQKRAVFNLTFVKCAAELAHFRVINTNTGGAWQYLKVVPLVKNHLDFIGFYYYDQSLGHQIANAFENEIFSADKQIAKRVVNQLMQLSFSLAVRIMLCVINREYFEIYYGIAEWQLVTLLSAFKILSAQIGKTNIENGIFPFQIIQIDDDGNYLWAHLLSPGQNSLEYNSDERQYIENFKFILRLSEFELTQYEIVKVLDAIMNENDEHPPAIYSFIKQHFASSLASSSSAKKQGNKLSEKLHCALITFGQMLDSSLTYFASAGVNDFGFFAVSTITDNNTPAKSCIQLEMELFHEPLWNYAQVVRIDKNICKSMLPIFDDLSKIVHSALETPSQNKNAIENLTNSKQFKLFKAIKGVNNYEDKLNSFFESYEKSAFAEKIMSLNELATMLVFMSSYLFEKYFENYGEKSFIEKMDSLKKVATLLDEMIRENSRAASCELTNQMNLMPSSSKFGRILYETLKKKWDNVRYDGMQQLLTFPLSVAEHFFKRLSAFVRRNLSANVQIDQIDFVKAIQAVTSADNVLESEKRQVAFWPRVNVEFFKMLFTLAIRLCWQIEENDFVEKYLPTFLHAHEKSIFSWYTKLHIFKYKINVEHGMVQINIPNWDLPYSVYLENENELKLESAQENFHFLQTLTNFSPTLYDVINMANILNEISEDDHICVGPSDPEIFLFILKYLNKSDEISEKTKLSVKNHFCFLAHFVLQLLEKVKAEKHLPTLKFVGIFVEKAQELCTDERIKDETSINFGENILNIGKALKLDFNLLNDIQHKILPNLIAQLEEMLKNNDWNYTKLNYLKMIEWNLLEFSLKKSGNGKKWKEIQLLLNKWKRKFNDSFYNANKRPNIQKVVEEIKEKLENLKDEKEWNEKEED